MPEILPFVPEQATYEFSTGLGGEEFVFNVRWNGRDEAWFIDILASDRTQILSGIKIVCGTLLGDRNTDPRFPNGVLQAIDLSGDQLDATFEDLGIRVVIYFFSDEELDAII